MSRKQLIVEIEAFIERENIPAYAEYHLRAALDFLMA